jgi:Ca-activated chloride channel family protein
LKFADKEIIIYLGWIIPLMLVFYAWALVSYKKRMGVFASSGLIKKIFPHGALKRKVFRSLFGIAALSAFIFALARPQWGFYWEENTFKGFDIMIALDTSRSMLADDVIPDRISFAKDNIRDFVLSLVNDRVGLIAFAGQAFLQCPMTPDTDGVLLVLNSVDTDSIPRGGTSISAAIEEAVRGYKGVSSGKKILVLVTDGERTTDDDLEKQLENAVREDLVISCIGIGSEEGILLDTGPGEDDAGPVTGGETRKVMTRLDEDTLRRIADSTGGLYVRARPGNFGLDTVYRDLLEKVEEKQVFNKISKVYTERFQFFLLAGLLFLAAEFLYVPGGGKKT